MISKKWRKLDKQLKKENEKNNIEEKGNEDNDSKKEILIIDVNNELEEIENEEAENEEGKEKNLKKKLSKPKPILNIDLNSINLINYKVNNPNNDSYQKYNNYSRAYDDKSYRFFLPKNYTNYSFSHLNSKDNINNHINFLSKSNDYTYYYSRNKNKNGISFKNYTNYNYLINRPYKLNKNNSYFQYLGNKIDKDNINPLNNKNRISFSKNSNLEEKPFNLNTKSYRRYQKMKIIQ